MIQMIKSLVLPESMSTERLLIQRLRPEDADEIYYGYASKPEATRFVSWPTHERIEDTRRYLDQANKAWDEGTELAFSIRDKSHSRLVGSFGLINEEGKIQFGYVISPSQWGRGYATEVCRCMMQRLRNNYFVYRVWTLVDADNVASIKVLHKSGLIEEVRLERWMRFVNQQNQPKDCLLFRLPLRSRL